MGSLFLGILVALGLGAVAYAVIYAVRRTTPAQAQITTAAGSIGSFVDQLRTGGLFSALFGGGSTSEAIPAGAGAGYDPAKDPARYAGLIRETANAVPQIVKIIQANTGGQSKPDDIFGTLPTSRGSTPLLTSGGSSGSSGGSGLSAYDQGVRQRQLDAGGSSGSSGSSGGGTTDIVVD